MVRGIVRGLGPACFFGVVLFPAILAEEHERLHGINRGRDPKVFPAASNQRGRVRPRGPQCVELPGVKLAGPPARLGWRTGHRGLMSVDQRARKRSGRVVGAEEEQADEQERERDAHQGRRDPG